jgi:hypothetical protein
MIDKKEEFDPTNFNLNEIDYTFDPKRGESLQYKGQTYNALKEELESNKKRKVEYWRYRIPAPKEPPKKYSIAVLVIIFFALFVRCYFFW